MKLQVYIDTSVVGGYFDDEFKDDTKAFFDRVFNKEFLVHFSEVGETELSLAPDFIKDIKSKIQLFNSINLKLGYPIIDIRSPREFVRYETND